MNAGIAMTGRRKGSTLAPEWQSWLAENLSVGVRRSTLLRTLVRSGVDAPRARAELDAVAAHPYVAAGQRTADRLAKAESLLDLYSDLFRQAGRGDRIEKRADLSEAEFFDRYYFAGRPVVIQGRMN